MSSNPRKFAEKIANIQRKAEEERANFDSIMKDVQGLTKKTPNNVPSNNGTGGAKSNAAEVGIKLNVVPTLNIMTVLSE